MKSDEGARRIDHMLVGQGHRDQGTVSYLCCPSVPASGFACLLDVII